MNKPNNSRNFSTVWTKHIKDEEKKEEFRKTILASTTMAKRLLEIAQEEYEHLDSQQTDFDSPSWAAKQAYMLGRKEQIRRLRELLSFVNN